MQSDSLIESAQRASTAEFLGAVRARLNARSLVSESEVPMPAIALERLLTLAFAGVPNESPTPPLTGYLRSAGIDEASGDYCALVTFEDQETARRAGALIFHNVALERAHETPTAANEEQHHARS